MTAPLRILVTSVPGFGHLGPLVPVARALTAAGHDVRLATHPSRHELMAAEGVRTVAAGITEAEMIAERPRRLPETEGRPNAEWAYRMFAEIMAPAMRADLLDLVSEWCPDLIIHEEGEYAGPVVAAEVGVPCVTHAWGSPLRPLDDLARLEDAATPLWRAAGLDVPPAAGLYVSGVIDPCPPFLQSERPGVRTAWQLRPEPAYRSSEQTQRDDVPGDGPFAYVGFGTVPIFANAPSEVTAAVEACIAQGLRTVVTTGDESLGRILTSKHGEDVVVRRFVSLAALLSRCALVVCDGGAGTVLAALSSGTPLVIVPKGAPSQLRMAAACAHAGVAIVARDSADLATAVSAATAPDVLDRAHNAASSIRSMPTATTIVPPLEELATH